MREPPLTEARLLIAALSELPEFTKPALEQLIGVPLLHAPDAAPEMRYYEATLSSGPFSRLRFREPNARQQQGWRLVILDVRDGVALPLTELQKDLIHPKIPPRFDPGMGAEGGMTFTVEQPGQVARFQFGARSQNLQLVAWHRDQDGG